MGSLDFGYGSLMDEEEFAGKRLKIEFYPECEPALTHEVMVLGAIYESRLVFHE